MIDEKTELKGYPKVVPSSGDPRFPSFLQGFNRRWAATKCQAIYLCYTSEGTARALDDAISHYGRNVQIKSGGHCYENFVFNEQVLAIFDITPMMAHGYDSDKGYYLESGGTNWSAFQGLFRDYGKILPSGSCYSVGLGGHICGGGYGLLSRLYGLTVDWLTGIEVVVKDKAESNAHSVYVSANSMDPDEKDLYWAHRGGGGGNFGVITKYYFKELPSAPKGAYITSFVYSWKDLTFDIFTQLLHAFASFAQQEDNWRQFGILHLNHVAVGEISITIQTAVFYGEEAEAIRHEYITPFLKAFKSIHPYKLMTKAGILQFSHLFHNTTETNYYTFYEAVQLLNGSGQNQRGKYKSAYMRKVFPQDQISAIFKWLTTTPDGLSTSDMQQSLLQVDTYGGQINLIGSTDTAIYQRSSILKLQYQTYWGDEHKDEAHLGWIRGFYSDVYKQTGGIPNPEQDITNNVDGCYYNYPDIDLNGKSNDKEIALQLYFGQNLKRLKKAKKRWNKNNYFNNSQSI
jgi:hypothetical protein